LQREIVKNNAGRLTHGLSKTPAYKAWAQAKQRCHNPNHPLWPNYGGRGISMAPEWRDDVVAFYDEVGPRPSPEHSLGRIDNDGNYEPGNVEWQLPEVQQNNKRPRKSYRERRSDWWEQVSARPASKEPPKEPPKPGEPENRRGWWFWRGRWRPK
jgi:hypothetical protein